LVIQVVRGWTGAQVEYWARGVLVMGREDAGKVGAHWTGAHLVEGLVDTISDLGLSPHAAHVLAAATLVSDWDAESEMW